MTADRDRRRRPGHVAVPLATTVVAGAAVTAVGWAAAHPAVPSPQPVAAPAPAHASAADLATRRQLEAAQRALELLRRDITALGSMRLPASSGPALGRSSSAPALPRAVPLKVAPAPPVAAAPAPPTSHTSTGASGAVH